MTISIALYEKESTEKSLKELSKHMKSCTYKEKAVAATREPDDESH